ncbi:hypothetical protein [Streptomyces sp. YU58]|uniref:hypothetical protein n=1 Tax=Streptomyces sp. SX92 TaxID=3158972 RepID=UPI0027BA7350|nr:hypothetical protein [Streptomyces coralus]WLW51271.1 hypothetical protein QU709_07850 [Streptomyces coralus]
MGTGLGAAVLGLVVATRAGTVPGTARFSDGFVRGLHISGAVTAAATLAAALLLGLLLPLARTGYDRPAAGEPGRAPVAMSGVRES